MQCTSSFSVRRSPSQAARGKEARSMNLDTPCGCDRKICLPPRPSCLPPPHLLRQSTMRYEPQWSLFFGQDLQDCGGLGARPQIILSILLILSKYQNQPPTDRPYPEKDRTEAFLFSPTARKTRTHRTACTVSNREPSCSLSFRACLHAETQTIPAPLLRVSHSMPASALRQRRHKAAAQSLPAK